MSRLPTPTPMKDKALAGIAEIRKRVDEAKKDWIAYSKSGEIRLNGAEVQAIGQIEMEALVRLTRSIIMSSVKVPFGNPHYEQFYAVRGNDIIELAGISGASEEEKHKLVARKDIRSHNVIFEFDEAVVLPTTDLPEVGAVAMDTDILKSDGEAEEGEETMDQDEDAEDSSDSVVRPV